MSKVYTEPGVYWDMPESEYFGTETSQWLNRSKIVKIETYSPNELVNPDSNFITAPALRIGSALHQWWLEGKKDWEIFPFSPTTAAGKAKIIECMKDGSLHLGKKEDAVVHTLYEGLEASKLCSELRANLKASEITILHDDFNGIPVKIRLDGLSKDGYIVDLKSSSAALTKESLIETIEKWGYMYQVCFYTDVAKHYEEQLGMKLKGWKFVFSSKATGKARVVTVDNADLEKYREEFRQKCYIAKEKLEMYYNNEEEVETELELF